MYLWLLERNDSNGYDETHGAVIAADTAREAQELAGNVGGDQPASIWFAPTTTIRAIGMALPGVEKGTVLRDFNAG